MNPWEFVTVAVALGCAAIVLALLGAIAYIIIITAVRSMKK